MDKYPDDNPKTVVGLTKPQIGLLPVVAVIHGALAMTDGAKKYGPYNWREKTVSVSIYLDAIERHIMSFRDGEDCAEDSGVHHLGHVIACCAIVLDAFHIDRINDDRPPKAPTAELIKRLTLVSTKSFAKVTSVEGASSIAAMLDEVLSNALICECPICTALRTASDPCDCADCSGDCEDEGTSL